MWGSAVLDFTTTPLWFSFRYLRRIGMLHLEDNSDTLLYYQNFDNSAYHYKCYIFHYHHTTNMSLLLGGLRVHEMELESFHQDL